ncbi:flagellar motor protein MotB [Herminiimonas fonticola]|uniref:Chemotaxis protein MotB n=1 Tax=Herminiimonas fonticola TaxID=303380 RepID=A0A4R6G8J3_9BURK|nr:flagellar motor protein MotB [Herminiimonas fonticola]RBA24145.1 Membrane MotB of proton-channel complex MotA/MotB [Herminiimonas fonticola]TDN90144.1 chemotaxis protein MotB [Herminiimonas fonticola]
MADEGLRPIIVKRIKKSGGGHHGGTWKIAYADFVTAMMAFFLLMWLLGSTTKGNLQGIADYFATPLKVAMAGGSGSGDATSVIKGGGKDMTRIDGQQKQGDDATPTKKSNLKAAAAELERQEMERLKSLKERIEEAIDSNPSLRQYKNQLLLDITSEGLRIQIVDEKNRPMFALSKAELQPYTKIILHEIAKTLNDIPNRISLSGHTDATPYSSGEKSYSNWELSSDRANASRRELIAGGMAESKMLRVVGLSSAVLFDPTDPLNPINRRISIIVMNKKTEDSITKENRTAEVADEETAKETVEKGVNISGVVQPAPAAVPKPTSVPVAPKPTASATATAAAAAAAGK